MKGWGLKGVYLKYLMEWKNDTSVLVKSDSVI